MLVELLFHQVRRQIQKASRKKEGNNKNNNTLREVVLALFSFWDCREPEHFYEQFFVSNSSLMTAPSCDLQIFRLKHLIKVQ
jgi:hypothetical protein